MNFLFYRGIVTDINDFIMGQNGESEGCYKQMRIEDGYGGIVHFIISPNTYFVNQAIVSIGDTIVGYYDGNAPVPLIYPPQYRAIIMVKERNDQNVKVDYFNNQLLSSDGQLQLNLSPYTPVLLRNGQPFSKNVRNRNLIVIYGPVTKSIPAQTTPYRIIIWCPDES